MTLDDLTETISDLGDTAKAAKEIYDKIQAEKTQFDAQTRRELRKVWIVISLATFVVGLGVGYLM